MTTTELRKGVCLKNILLATDLSEASNNALAYAAAFARLHDAKLFVVHVMPPEPRMSLPLEPLPSSLDRFRFEAERNLKSLAAADPLRDISHEEILEEGSIRNVVSNLIRQKEIDLLVLGTHARTGVKKLLFGSVAEELFRLAPCPVLTVGPAVTAGKVGKVEAHRVLFATDFGAASLNALPYAISLANESAGKLILLHVVTPMPVPDASLSWYVGTDLVERQETSRRSTLERLQKLVSESTDLACEVELIAGFDFVPEGILKVTSDRQVDLIVMGVKRSAIARASAHMPWAVAHEVVCQAKCPVLTVRG